MWLKLVAEKLNVQPDELGRFPISREKAIELVGFIEPLKEGQWNETFFIEIDTLDNIIIEWRYDYDAGRNRTWSEYKKLALI